MKNINDLIDKHKILYIIFTRKDGSIVNSVGDSTRLKYSGVREQYFANKEKVISTSEFLQGKQLPQLIIQGNQCCILSILENSILVGIFFFDDSNVLLRRKRVKIIYEDVLNLDLIDELK